MTIVVTEDDMAVFWYAINYKGATYTEAAQDLVNHLMIRYKVNL